MEHLSEDELSAAFESFCSTSPGVVEETFNVGSPRFVVLCGKAGSSPQKMAEFFKGKLRDIFGEESGAGIDLKRFSQLYYRLEFDESLPNKDIYMEVFDFMDADNSKMLEPIEIRQAIERATGSQVDEERYAKVMEEMDTNQDNQISASEFMDWIHKLHKRMHLVD